MKTPTEAVVETAVKRNNTIDTLRGFAMMYVVFIHCLYHTGLFNGHYSSILKSLFLIEMPLFFFIAGASNSLGRKRDILTFYLSRFQRIILPYWIYGIFCIIITLVVQKIIPFEQSKYVSFDIPLIFKPLSRLPYITLSLWFIPVYLYTIFLFPFLKWYYERHNNDNKKFIPLLFFVIMLSNNGWEILYDAKMVLFYSFWMYLGLFFSKFSLHESIKSKKNVIPVILFCAILTIWFIQKNQSYADMQNNKFPPNIVFMVYTIGALSFFYLVSKYILTFISILRKNRVFDWIYKQYVQNCYTVFLYHPLPFLATAFVLNKIPWLKEWLYSNQFVCFFVYIIITIPGGAVLGKLFSWGEKIKIKYRQKGETSSAA